MLQKSYYTLLFLFLLLSGSSGQSLNYQVFDNIDLNTEASVITAFVQDPQGLIWIGSNKGLFSYDGYTSRQHFTLGERNNTRIHCGIVVDSTWLYLGSDNGLLVYNYRTDQYEEINIPPLTDIRILVQHENNLWIGSLNGLYTYDLQTHTLTVYKREEYPGLPHETIYSLILTKDHTLYIRTYDGFCCYRPSSGTFHPIELPANPTKANQFINSLLNDTTRNCIWIGMEGDLIKYDPVAGSYQQVNLLSHNSIKTMALDITGNLLLGTDNGLYIYNETDRPLHITHDSRNTSSLKNNIVWTIFTDKEHNAWLGTDFGISLARYNNSIRYIPISQITGTGEGNQFYSLFKDSKNNYWFGGTNGLLRFTSPDLPSSPASWYKMGDYSYPLTHNRIRHLYEDSDNHLWIATDGSLNRYNYATHQFIHYNIVDSSGTFNSNWAYYLCEDVRGNLWIATCLGGIFVVNKEKLLQSSGHPYVAEYNYTTDNGLAGMFIQQIVPDHQGNIWVLLYNNGIDKINMATHTITSYPVGDLKGENNPNYLICDQSGVIWAGFRGGVMRIDPTTERPEMIRFNEFSNNEVLSMMEVGTYIWLSTTEGIWIVSKDTYETRRLPVMDKVFSSLYFDPDDNNIYLGTTDGFAIASSGITHRILPENPLFITSLFINWQETTPVADNQSQSIRYTNSLRLKHDENNLTIGISDLSYAMEEKNKFVYYTQGVDKDWNVLPTNSNRISYTNLLFGNYELNISKLDLSGQPVDAYTLFITITPPWYYTWWAKTIYGCLLISLIAWGINFFRVKNRLKIERIEKEKIEEQSRLKIDFFTNIFHELKTPLSMIITPVSQMLLHLKDGREKTQPKLVQRNAIKLNTLIHQALDFNRIDNHTNASLILSKIDLITFTKNIFTIYQEAGKQRSITCHFESNCEQLYIEADVIKLEAILSNMLSNAYKYTPNGGEIRLQITVNETDNTVGIAVSDTGIGIPAKDLPYVFQRFFQSAKTAKATEGTGVGLYMVKSYVELHGGTATIISEEDKGTTIQVIFPLLINNQELQPEKIPASTEEATTETGRPTVLIVEDNIEIATFLYSILKDTYQCLTAINGKEGLKICFDTLPNLIIADLMMPVMNGLEMCKQIKNNVPTSTIPIILLTAKNDKKTELESIRAHIDAFITKPFEPEILLSRIGQLLYTKKAMEAKLRIEAITTPEHIEAISHDEKFLATITEIIEDKVADDTLNVNALCEIAEINSKQVYRKIKRLTGMTPVEYIKSIRMKKAAMLLQQQKFTVAEVMYMVGFSSHSYFSKCFQAEFGKSPRQYINDLTSQQ